MRRYLFPILLLILAPAALPAQSGDWDSARALDLVERARDRRATPFADSGLVDYQGKANGFVYFYLDRQNSEERTLVKVDQIALDIMWRAPDQTFQRIVGLRDVSNLPNRMHYHLDHLTVVQDEFGDAIRLGDGDEVQDVPHPAAPGSDSIYQYRLADSLTLRLPGAPEPVRVYELQVRPRQFQRPAFVGSVFVDRANADIVRMHFTFTPASYVDRRLDYINVSLDNGLWQGRYWLPHEQRVEIRRQLPELDFPAGGVIRGVLRIGDYRFNSNLPAALFRGPPVVALPRALREQYEFPEEIYADLAAEGLAPTADLAELRARAVSLVGSRYLSGLPRVRLHLPGASSALRYDRAEGLFLGMGISYAAAAATTLQAHAGFATAAEHLSANAAVLYELGPGTSARVDGFVHQLRDLGLRPGVPGALNTILAASAGEDYLDPYFAHGGRVSVSRALTRAWQADVSLTAERHESATLEQSRAPLLDSELFRPVRPVDEGKLWSASLQLQRHRARSVPLDWLAHSTLEAGSHEGAGFARALLGATLLRPSPSGGVALELRVTGGAVSGSAPTQKLFLLGGPATLPGYRYRSLAGHEFVLAELAASTPLADPWLNLRAGAAVGWTALDGPIGLGDWAVSETGGARASLGFGVGIFHDILRIELARGLNRGGVWQFVTSVRPDLWDVL